MPATGDPQTRRALLKAAAMLAPMAALGSPPSNPPPAEPAVAPPDPRNSAPAPAHPAIDDFRPGFFTPAEWAFLNAACDRLIPKDEHGPGAVELGVPQYIDRQMGTAWAEGGIWYMQGPFYEAKPEFGYQSALTPKQQYRVCIKAIDALCQQKSQKTFAELPPAEQDAFLKDIESGALTAPDAPLKTFFSSFLLKNVMEGYFGDPMYGGNKDMAAWVMIAYPGVRADYLEWVGSATPYPYGPVSIRGRRG